MVAVDESEVDVGLVFLTQRGGRWVKVGTSALADGTLKVHCDDAVSKETAKLMKILGINGHRNFYALRHTFETIGGEAKDQVAVDHVMGHARDDMAAAYRERISDERLKAVTDHIRGWLFAEPAVAASASGSADTAPSPAA